MVCVLSIFTDLRVSDEYKINIIGDFNVSENVKSSIKLIENQYDYYYDLESKFETICADNYNYNLHYDLCDVMVIGIATSETQCKRIYHTALKKDIFVAEFVKAVLKINNIGSELEKVCVLENKLELLSKVKKIPELLKSIIQSNSLYLHLE